MTKKSTRRETLKKILIYLKKHRKLLWLSLLLALITTVSSLYAPVIIGRGIDDIKGEGSVDFDAIEKKLLLMMRN